MDLAVAIGTAGGWQFRSPTERVGLVRFGEMYHLLSTAEYELWCRALDVPAWSEWETAGRLDVAEGGSAMAELQTAALVRRVDAESVVDELGDLRLLFTGRCLGNEPARPAEQFVVTVSGSVLRLDPVVHAALLMCNGRRSLSQVCRQASQDSSLPVDQVERRLGDAAQLLLATGAASLDAS
jgi:hypothetical protein